MYKSRLQELCHQRSWGLPEYRTVKDGPDHNPRFTSTVTINGVPYQTPPNQCRSAKEAQNLAAQLAFQQLSLPPQTLNGAPSSSTPVGAPSSSTPADINPEQIALLLNQESPSGLRDDTGPKEILHTFKNRLQHFTQKHNISMPAYSSDFEGPPHARRFRSKVIIADKTYECSEFFSTLKEAEHAAAKVAFEAISHDDIQEDETLFKTLLQELAQKKGLQFPKYSTDRSGPSHVPTFVSNVEVGSDIFQGLEAKTKKQAEMSAAKVAYNALLKRKEEQGLSGYHLKGVSGVTSFNLQSAKNKVLVQDIAQSQSITGEAAANKEIILKETLANSTSGSHIVTNGQHNIQPTTEQTSVKEQNADKVAKIEREQSPTSKLNAQLQDPSPLTSAPEPSTSITVNRSNCVCSGTKHHTPTEEGHKSSRKFIVYPKDVEIATPGAASIMPYSDDQYVALKLTDNTMQ